MIIASYGDGNNIRNGANHYALVGAGKKKSYPLISRRSHFAEMYTATSAASEEVIISLPLLFANMARRQYRVPHFTYH